MYTYIWYSNIQKTARNRISCAEVWRRKRIWKYLLSRLAKSMLNSHHNCCCIVWILNTIWAPNIHCEILKSFWNIKVLLQSFLVGKFKKNNIVIQFSSRSICSISWVVYSRPSRIKKTKGNLNHNPYKSHISGETKQIVVQGIFWVILSWHVKYIDKLFFQQSYILTLQE